ncbi:MAG TPA: 4-hydroxy-tetrahydrodipicolinate synthase [Candidatus Butyricicoccus avicola]|nr:4-hydroxy-tetrahydrodipicolinate synthase [Candidatus Butyricicoccus avicola]
MKKPVFTGAGVAIITPFTSTGEVNYDEFKKILDYQIDHGTDAIIIVGTTGESSTMTLKEHAEVVDFGCSYVAGRVPVVAGAGSNDTAAAVELTREAAKSGADAVLSVTPYYNKTTQRGLIAHFQAIADCSDCPVILYNVPSRTGLSISPETYKVLSEHPNINGSKEASGNFSLLAEAMHLCGDNMNFWSGNDDQIVPLMSMGGKGVISVLSNVAPAQTHKLTQLCLEGKFDEASRLQIDYMPLIKALFCEVNPIPVKKAMELLGWQVGDVRLPLVGVTAEHEALLRRELDKMGCKI